MATKKTVSKKTHHHPHSPHRPVRTREMLITLVFGSLVLVFIMMTIINVTSP